MSQRQQAISSDSITESSFVSDGSFSRKFVLSTTLNGTHPSSTKFSRNCR
ncbi:unnamed protein product [Toxocara canis]|uniref:Uncharacterized protein n=1 Tax=Toxocara canis TaxID=6265 RepID=A0A183UPP2_TOXCA|nr:unnamed protein product [Toxocara canis]